MICILWSSFPKVNISILDLFYVQDQKSPTKRNRIWL